MSITVLQAKEELQKIKDVVNGTGFLYFALNYVQVSHPTKGCVNWRGEMYE